MSKEKIKRGLTDQDMVGKWQEQASFEHCIEEAPVKPTAPAKKESFFSIDLQDKVSKSLLEVKLALFQQGIVDYEIKVSRESNKVILTAVPRPPTKGAGAGKKV